MKHLFTLCLLLIASLGWSEKLPSGTLPVLYISTKGGQAIKNKVDYIDAIYYLDPMGQEGTKAVGSAEQQLPLQIKGRGNYTWRYFDKKPYRIKLGEKKALLGMNKSRHFALLAHADDNVAFLRNTVAFEVSRCIGFPFTPEQRPVEVVLNGDYIGLYFLTETVRVAKDRVNILEQADGTEDPDSITGGWLVEIDNNVDEQQLFLSVENTLLRRFRITYHSPDSLSQAQSDYLTVEMESLRDAIFDADKQSTRPWEMIDIRSMAQMYIVHEVVDHLEGFVGSCYLYKDFQEQRWHFGPVWDLGNGFNDYHSKQMFIYEDNPFPYSIMHEVVKFPRFQQEVRSLWAELYPQKLAHIETFMHDFLTQIAAAAAANAVRWPQYGNADVTESSQQAFSSYRDKVEFLNSQWGMTADIEDIVGGELQSPTGRFSRCYNINGSQVECFSRPGFYIMIDGNGRTVKYVKR